MKPAFGQDISLMRFFGSRKQTYANRLVINFYLGQPFTVFFSYAKKTAFIASAMPILRVFHVRDFAQICKLIVATVAVNMVNLIRRPSSFHIKPSQTMRQVQHVVQSNTNVTVFHLTPGNIAQTAPAPNFSPSKKAGFSVVFQKFMQSFWSHSVNINSAMCGGQV